MGELSMMKGTRTREGKMAGETERGFSRMPQKSDSERATHVWRHAGGTRPRLQLG